MNGLCIQKCQLLKMEHDVTQSVDRDFNDAQKLEPWGMRDVSVFCSLSWQCPRSHLICSKTFAFFSSQIQILHLLLCHESYKVSKNITFSLTDSHSLPHSASSQTAVRMSSTRAWVCYSSFIFNLTKEVLEYTWIGVCFSYNRNQSNTDFF